MSESTNRIQCLRCGTELSKIGRREMHFGQVLRNEPSRISKMPTDAFVCTQCGHIEFLHPRYGADMRADNPPLLETTSPLTVAGEEPNG